MQIMEQYLMHLDKKLIKRNTIGVLTVEHWSQACRVYHATMTIIMIIVWKMLTTALLPNTINGKPGMSVGILLGSLKMLQVTESRLISQ